MSYVVLARKYRPRSFEQMVGQAHVVRALSNALQQQRLHHAYLFTGTRGIGKTTISRILAKSLNCIGPDGRGGITATPCGVCSACVEIDEDRYLDYIELDAASNRGIDEARDLLERAAYKPGIGRFKVFMIDEAHQLTKDAFSALLKTLEEPPDYLKFVLATTDPEKMLPTVLSRCLQFNLRPMAPDLVQQHLQQVLHAEGVAFDSVALQLLARAARGSMRDALSLTDQAIAYGSGRLEDGAVRAMLGAVDHGHAEALVESLAQRDGPGLLAGIDRLRELGLSADGTLEAMARLLQRMAVQQAVPAALDASDDEHAAAVRLAAAMSADETQLLYSIVLHGRGELQLMSDEYGALTMVLLRMLAFSLPVKPEPVQSNAIAPVAASSAMACGAGAASPARAAPSRVAAETPPGAASRTAAGGSAALRVAPLPSATVPAAPAATEDAADTDSVATSLGDRWADQVANLVRSGAVAALVRELAQQAGLERIDESTQPPTWHLRVELDSLRSEALRDKLCQALAATRGEAVQLVLLAGTASDSPARRDAAERERRQRHAEDSIRGDPLVRELMSQFKGARIVPGSIKPL